MLTPAQRFTCMSHNRAKNTGPELLLRRSLWQKGFRYRVNDKRFPGSPDILLPKYHTAIFVNGCFWHGHKGCTNYTIPKTNTDYWIAKVQRNQERDQKVWRKLEAMGWNVLIVWECRLKKELLDSTVNQLIDTISKNGENYKNAMVRRRQANADYLMNQQLRKEKELAALNEIKSIP